MFCVCEHIGIAKDREQDGVLAMLFASSRNAICLNDIGIILHLLSSCMLLKLHTIAQYIDYLLKN